MLKVLRQLPKVRQFLKVKPAKPTIKEKKIETEELEVGISTAPMYEPIKSWIIGLIGS